MKHFSEKFLTVVSIIALLKCCSIVSCKLDRPRLSIVHIAPSRELKSYTSYEAMRIFDPSFYIDLGSDFTMNSLKRYKIKLKNNRCLLCNDGTILFSSKSQRVKNRLVGGLAELISDGKYTYQDGAFTKFTLEGNITLIMNMTSQSYQNNKYRYFSTTFSERILQIHHRLTREEKDTWLIKADKTKNLRYDEKITINDICTNVTIPEKYYNRIRRYARRFSYPTLKTQIGCQDLVIATLLAHASLNNRSKVCNDDFVFLRMIEPYLTNPFSPNNGKILEYYDQGLSYRQICRKLGKKKSYVGQVQDVLKIANLRGVITKRDNDEEIID